MELFGEAVDVFRLALREPSRSEGFYGASDNLGRGWECVEARVFNARVEEGDEFVLD